MNEIKNDYSCGLNFGEDFLIEEISFIAADNFWFWSFAKNFQFENSE